MASYLSSSKPEKWTPNVVVLSRKYYYFWLEIRCNSMMSAINSGLSRRINRNSVLSVSVFLIRDVIRWVE